MSDQLKKKIHRVQIDFSESAYDQLLKLKEDANAESVSNLIRDALGFYSFCTEEWNRGAELLVRKDGEVQHITITRTTEEIDSNTTEDSDTHKG